MVEREGTFSESFAVNMEQAVSGALSEEIDQVEKWEMEGKEVPDFGSIPNYEGRLAQTEPTVRPSWCT